MEFTVNKHGENVLTFKSPVNSDNGYTNTHLGDFESTMTLSIHDDSTKRNGSGNIEWDIEKLGTTENIGLSWSDGKLDDYDGVFELPKQAVKLIRKYGIRVPKEFLD